MKISSLFYAILLSATLLTNTNDAFSQRRFPYRFDLDSRSLDTLYTPDATSSLHRYRITAWGTYSMWAFFIGFLGAGPFYLTLERQP